MEEVRRTQNALQDLCTSIQSFISNADGHFVSPVIDYHHPNDYSQRGIQGIRKFLSQAESERDYVTGLAHSASPPNEFTTNAPHLLAVWDEVQRAKPPICLISQKIESIGNIKIDVIADGGNEWIKVNTIKESRLMAEFREQDSYINSDYDSTDSEEAASIRYVSPPALVNSVIDQATSLIIAAKAYSRPAALPHPRVTLVLSRLEEFPERGYEDSRIPATFAAVKTLGVNLVFQHPQPSQPMSQASQPPEPSSQDQIKPLRPRHRILLDLSVVIALCCDSTHRPLPNCDAELESRFRPFRRSETDGKIEIGPHTTVSSDLRDQLKWEAQHPLIEEIQDRLSDIDNDLEFWATEEVKQRVPGIVDVIGGPSEKARAKALFDARDDFWAGSRYEGKEGVLEDLHVRVLDEENDISGLDLVGRSTFERSLISTCQKMLDLQDPSMTRPSTRCVTDGHLVGSSIPPYSQSWSQKKPKGGQSRKSRQPIAAVPPARLPSAHTLRTLVSGVQNRMTILTNNRGAVGKVIREMGVSEGIPDDVAEERRAEAVIWVVNPSSLAEWRRREVEASNERLKTEIARALPMGASEVHLHV
ncbi:hypothetical protein BCR39DRAFT_540799 [Naematelia encephala]|uniref:DUF1308 domain-containing protein n=1 Tax=Naematelia encephala TaxID=71784 RepID=A0A1Y2AVV4_9TREE|nr:hypothetical protein BCR39DRAFT_540799 [Naematelia encephala]